MTNAFTKTTTYEGITEYKLNSNGLKVLLVPQPGAPVVAFMVVYLVGSRNEAVGHTGATHLLEHMLFKGTPTYNKHNGTQIAAVLQKQGAVFNADTWYDRTRYFEMLPNDQLELAIHLEADRMRNSFIADDDRQSEMTVVRNELERGENDPGRVLDQRVWATAFREHPYHHPTIGWRSDVEGIPTERLKEFYNVYYYPNNAVALLVGQFEEAQALDLIAKHFGAIPGKRLRFDAADLPGVNLTFSASETPVEPTKGRAMDHIGFEIKGLEAFVKKLEAAGVKFDVPYRKVPALGISIAFFTDPWGAYVELTEGLDKI